MPATSIGAGLLASPAGVLRSSRDDHANVGRHLVEALGDILTDDVQCTLAAGTDLALRFDNHLLVRQVIEACVTAGAAFARALSSQRSVRLLVLGFGLLKARSQGPRALAPAGRR